MLRDAARAALTPHRGPVFLDVPLDVIFSPAEARRCRVAAGGAARRARPGRRSPRRPALLAAARAAGDRRRRRDVWAGDAEAALRRGGRGAAGAGVRQRHGPRRAAGRRTRSRSPGPGGPRCRRPTWSSWSARRWTSGSAFGDFGAAQVVHLADAAGQRAAHAPAAGRVGGRRPARDPRRRSPTVAGDRSPTTSRVARRGCAPPRTPAGPATTEALAGDADPIKPARGLRRAAQGARRDAVVIGDGGDFVSYAGKYLEPLAAGHLARPRSVRLPRHRPGLRDGRPGWPARTARSACCSGDGAAGFSLMDVEYAGPAASCRW